MPEQSTAPLSRLIDLAQRLVPPGLLSVAKRTGLYPWGFKGDFSSWEDARRAAGTGYEDPAIVSRVAADTRELIAALGSGRVATTTPTLRLLGAFFRAIHGRKDAEIRVADFGGALGAHYFSFRALLPAMKLRWVVHETAAMCSVGRAHFATDALRFASSPEEAGDAPDVVLASGSIQYLEDPIGTLGRLSRMAPFLIVDRLPLSRFHRDRITLQVVPPWIYRGGSARFPAWFLGQDTWARQTEGRVVLSWESEERVQLGTEEISCRGFLLRGQG